MIDARCVPDLVSPTLAASYDYYIAQSNAVIDLTGFDNGNCKFSLATYVSGGPNNLDNV